MEGIKVNIKYSPEDNNIVIVELGGYVDQTNCHQVEKTISDIIRSEKLKIVFDFSQLVYMSSAGWGIFVGEIKLIRDMGGDIKIAAMSPEVYEVFQMLEFFHIIQDYATVEEAVSAFQGEKVHKTVPEATPQSEPDEKTLEDLLQESVAEPEAVSDDSEDEIIIEDDENEESLDNSANIIELPQQQMSVVSEPEKVASKEFKPVDIEPRLDIAKLPLTEKIKKLVTNYPLLSIFQMRKMLRHEKFGHTRVGLLKLYRTLKTLNLDSREKRYRFYRSS